MCINQHRLEQRDTQPYLKSIELNALGAFEEFVKVVRAIQRPIAHSDAYMRRVRKAVDIRQAFVLHRILLITVIKARLIDECGLVANLSSDVHLEMFPAFCAETELNRDTEVVSHETASPGIRQFPYFRKLCITHGGVNQKHLV